MRSRELEIAGWGRARKARVRAWRPEREAELDRSLAEARPRTAIAVGARRAYGDAALNDGGDAILTQRLDRFLAFDPATGTLEAEPGATFRDLAGTFLARGWMAPASPGTAFATLGGGVAADVHGKNHDRHGSFGDHLRWLDLLGADGVTRRVSPTEHAELFAATIGGMGLTGIVRRLAVALLPAPATAMRVVERPVADLDAHLAALFAAREASTFSVGWIDALASGASLGRGILETAEFAPGATPPAPGRALRVPVDAPGFALNPWSVRLFNRFYARRIPAAGRESIRRFDAFLYPLDAIAEWNRIYGKRGFYQFQGVVPDAEAPRALRRMLEAIAAGGRASFLAVIKTLGGEGRGMLSFPMRGVTLALDFPRVAGVEALIDALNRLTLEHGGRVYLAKDALLTADLFRQMYPRAGEFAALLERIDPDCVFASDMARRLGLRPARAA